MESFSSSLASRALSLPMASDRPSAAAGSNRSPRAWAVRCTSSTWPAPSQMAGRAKLASKAWPAFTSFCNALVVRRRASGLPGFTSTRWQVSGSTSRPLSNCSANSAGHWLQKGLRCRITTRAPDPKGGVRASARAWAAWPASLPSSRLRLMLPQVGSISFSTRASMARLRAASSSPQ